MFRFSSRDGEEGEAAEGDSLTTGTAVSKPRGGREDEEESLKETMLNAISVLFFVMLGLIVIFATFKSHQEYSKTSGKQYPSTMAPFSGPGENLTPAPH